MLALNMVAYAAVVPVLFFQSPFSSTDYLKNANSSSLEEITIQYDGGTLYGWKCGTASDTLLLYFGGDNTDSNSWIRTVWDHHPEGLGSEATVLTIDYPTFGKSSGTISEKTFYETAVLLYEYARQRYPEAHIISAGYSIGSAAALRLACTRDCSALILVGPMYDGTSLYLRRDGILHRLFEPFASVKMQNDEDAPRCAVGTLVIASKTDHITKLQDITSLCSLFRIEPDFFVLDKCAHGEYWDRDEVYAVVADFLRGVSREVDVDR